MMLLENEDQCEMIDFKNYCDLEYKSEIFSSLIECYKKVFFEAEYWRETYTTSEVKEKLKKELTGDAALRLVVLNDAQGSFKQVIAFCWAQCLFGFEIVDSFFLIHYINTDTNIKREDIEHLVDNSKFLYLNDLGVINDYKNLFSLGDLIMPVLSQVAIMSNVDTLFFWCIRNTPAALISKAGRMEIIAEFDDIQFFKCKVYT